VTKQRNWLWALGGAAAAVACVLGVKKRTA
jgi:hypothetical protein